MPRIPLDVTTAGVIPAGDYVGTISTLKYQIKTGDKWNKDGTSDTDGETFQSFGDDKRRLHYTILIPGKGNIFHDLYLMPAAAGFVQQFLKSAGVGYDKTGFDPEEAVGKEIGLQIAVEDVADYGPRNLVSKFYKV